MKKAIYILLLSLTATFFACNDGFDDFSTNPQHRLTFSVDTLAFDTILTAVTTPVAGFKVYNRNDKALLISSIQLKGYPNSRFKINVDGMAGDSFRDVEIRAQDSLFVFVDVKPVENGTNTPILISDRIEFVTNTVTQKVILEAHGQDVTVLRGLVIEADTILAGEKPYLVYDSLMVRPGATLNLAAGTRFYMHSGTDIVVEGTLKVTGTADQPVEIRGDRMDWLFSNLPYDRLPGQWNGIFFRSTSFNNTIEHANIRNGNYGLYFERSDSTASKMEMRNLILKNFKGTLIRAVNSRITAENCEFSNAKDALLSVTGGSYEFTHCTFANYYPSSIEMGFGNSKNETLILNNKTYDSEGEEILLSIEKADFRNSIVAGSSYTTSDITIVEDEESSIAFSFLNCLLPNEEKEKGNHYIRCIIDKKPMFVKSVIRDEEDRDKNYFVYIYELTKDSPAVNAADGMISQYLPYDLNGLSRTQDEAPDMGAYEYLPAPEE